MTNASPVDQLSIPPCCPKLAPNTVCDILNYQYRQLYHPKVGDRIVTVDVIIHVRFQRCPLALGDLVTARHFSPAKRFACSPSIAARVSPRQ